MAGIRGKRPIYPSKGGKAKAMFSGTDPSGPHKGLKDYALATPNSGRTAGKVKGPSEQGLRHQKHYGKGA